MGEKDNIEKFTLWETSTRVPLIINFPGITEPGSVCRQPVSLMDLYPTLVDIAGFEAPGHLDGQSLLPQIKDPEAPTDPVISSYMFTWTDQPVVGHAVRSLQYRYIYYPEVGLEELYNHQVDPKEWDNVAYRQENQQVVADHRQVLLTMLPELTWSNEVPEGYTVDEQGKVYNTRFKSLDQVTY